VVLDFIKRSFNSDSFFFFKNFNHSSSTKQWKLRVSFGLIFERKKVPVQVLEIGLWLWFQGTSLNQWLIAGYCWFQTFSPGKKSKKNKFKFQFPNWIQLKT